MPHTVVRVQWRGRDRKRLRGAVKYLDQLENRNEALIAADEDPMLTVEQVAALVSLRGAFLVLLDATIDVTLP